MIPTGFWSDDRIVFSKMIFVPKGTNVVTILEDFYICQYETKQQEWQKIMGTNPSNTYGVGKNYPVYNTSWYDAVEYCNTRSIKEGLTPAYSYTKVGDNDLGEVTEIINVDGYRLPKKNEWEYAARGGLNGTAFTYSGSNDINDVAWYGAGITHRIGTKLPNELNIYDMSGNVWEWCWDYTSSNKRVNRGGGVTYDGSWCSVSVVDSTSHHYRGLIGFRIAKAARILVSIAITTPATKLIFAIGESLDIAGLIVTGTYNDGTTKTESITTSLISGFNSSTIGIITLTITIKTKTTTYDVEIIEAIPLLVSIAITTPATKLIYNIGETLDITGLVVTGTYDDSTTKIETITESNISGFNSTTAGTITLTITVDTKTTTYQVTIIDPFIPVMILVPAGTTSAQNGSITVAADFYICEYEVTQKEYFDIMGTNPSGGYGVSNNYPVYGTSWYDAIEYCNARSTQEGLTLAYTYTKNGDNDLSNVTEVSGANGYRLPKKNEWQYATRGGKDGIGYVYSGSNTATDVAWFVDNSGASVHTVGTKLPNELNLYDMSGNVWEWCWDLNWGTRRFHCGGFCNLGSYYCDVSISDSTACTYRFFIGFRVARSL